MLQSAIAKSSVYLCHVSENVKTTSTTLPINPAFAKHEYYNCYMESK